MCAINKMILIALAMRNSFELNQNGIANNNNSYLVYVKFPPALENPV